MSAVGFRKNVLYIDKRCLKYLLGVVKDVLGLAFLIMPHSNLEHSGLFYSIPLHKFILKISIGD